jgi:hypothetical protein
MPNRWRQRLVDGARRLAADPQAGRQHEIGALERRIAIGRLDELAAPAAMVEDPARQSADDGEPLGV